MLAVVEGYVDLGLELEKVGPSEMVYFDHTIHIAEELAPYGGRYGAVVFKIKPAAS